MVVTNYLAVRKYGNCGDKPPGMPSEWPCEVRELGQSQTLPDDGHVWTLMTPSELVSHMAQYQDEYDEWWEDQPPPPKIPAEIAQG